MEVEDIKIEEFVKQSIAYWYNANDHVRCPFPDEIRETLEQNTIVSFNEMLIEFDATNKLEFDELIELLEVLVFNEAVKLVDDEDQQLTIMYPFMPRVGDVVKDVNNGEGNIIERKSIVSKENKKTVEVTVQSVKSADIWKTEFELPA